MKKVKTIKVPAQPATTRTVERIICDFCLKVAVAACQTCDRDICAYHRNFDDNDISDYPDKWCPICSQLEGERHFDRVEIRAEADRKEELIDKQIKTESLARNVNDHS